MRISYLSSLVLLMGLNASGAEWPGDGIYQGGGVKLDADGTKRTFTMSSLYVTTGSDTFTLKDTYTTPDGSSTTFQYDLTITPNGSLTLRRDGKKAGVGYCVEGACHLSYALPDSGVSGEETIIQNGEKIHRVGTRVFGGTVTRTRTDLDKLN